ncbi:MAG: SgcJ/EcaC family oxidoreductase [Bacteroidetes bacterium]|nr:SgcJ/EcaC family oxidoreductase [Bacteroidota bacterium]
MDNYKITEEIFKKIEDSWNNGSGEGFGSLFTEDADFVDIRGDLHKSRTEISKGHEAILNSIYKGSKVNYKIERVKEISDGVLLAHVSAELNAPSGPLAGINNSLISALILKQGSDYLITAFHNTLKR